MIKNPLRVHLLSCLLSIKMPNKDADDRLTSFLNLLLGIDSGVMAFLLVIAHYNPGGFQLPATLPATIQSPHHELTFGCQVFALALCAATILIIHAFSLWKHQSQRYQKNIRGIAVLLLAVTPITIVTAGLKIVNNPGLLKEGEQKQNQHG